MPRDKDGNWIPEPHLADSYSPEEVRAAKKVMTDFRSAAAPPNNLGKEFNLRSRADYEKLRPEDRQQFDMIEVQKNTEIEQTKADNERHREKRIEKEMDRLVRKPAPGLNGPAPVIGGVRVDQPDGVAKQDLTPEQLKNLRETASDNVRKADEAHLLKIERPFTQAQRDLLDRSLGPDRYPSHKR